MFVQLFLICLTSSQITPFTASEVAQMREYFEANIGLPQCFPGFVVAAPTDDNPDYFYHWQRDAGISMHTLQYTAPNTSDFNERMQNYTKWVVKVQTESDPNNEGSTIGEPKFNCDGSVYSGGWCRPQNDGPASRAIALIEYALYLLDNGNNSYVNQYLFHINNTNDNDIDNHYNHRRMLPQSCTDIANDAKVDCGHDGTTQQECENDGCCWYEIHNNPNNDPWCFYPNTTRPTPSPTTPAPTAPYAGPGTIVTDLNYVQSNWQSTNNCDLWEEINGYLQFYTLMVQRYALLFGSQLATKLGQTNIANLWTKTANNMVDSINSFNNNGNIQEKQRQDDCSIYLGSLYGGTPDKFLPNAPELYPPSNEDILKTVNITIAYFKKTYPINADNTQGTLVGRYAADRYSGCDSNGGSQGHAWILCSNAIGDLYYRNSQYYHKNANICENILSKNKLQIISDILLNNGFPYASNYLREYIIIYEKLSKNDFKKLCENIGSMFLSMGDGQIGTVAQYVRPCNMHMSEQICEASIANGGGLEIGAHDLTWSYGTILSAMYYKDEAVSVGVKPWEFDVLKSSNYKSSMEPGETCNQVICNGQCKD